MPALPPRPDLDQLRRLAKDLVRAARSGDQPAIDRLGAVSAPSTLAGAQLAIAREYGFPSWAALKRAVERREILDARDVERLGALLSDEPELAWTTMEHWGDHPKGTRDECCESFHKSSSHMWTGVTIMKRRHY